MYCPATLDVVVAHEPPPVPLPVWSDAQENTPFDHNSLFVPIQEESPAPYKY